MPYGNMGTIWSEMGLDYSGLTRGMLEALGHIKSFEKQSTDSFRGIAACLGDALASIGQSLSIGITAPLTAAGTVVAKASADFETSMANVWTIADISKEELQGSGTRSKRYR